MKRTAALIMAVTVLTLISGCESEQDAKLKRGVGFARINIEKIGRDPMATAAFQSMAEQGGDIQHYLVACMRDPESLPEISKDAPAGPWTVVIKDGPGPEDYTIEGYGEDISKPIMSVVAVLSYQKPVVAKENVDGEPGQDPPITTAASQGDASKVEALIKKGANVNAMSVEGATGLMYAAAKGHVEVVKLLLSAHADVNVRSLNKESWTALMCAVSGGSAEIVSMLLEKGASVNASHAFAQTALMNASSRGSAEMVDLLLKAGADINASETMAGNSALSLAISKEHGDIVKTLIESGANVNHAANNGLTILMLAASKGQKETVNLLISHGAILDAKDPNGNAALRYAEHGGFSEIAELLKGAKPEPAVGPADGIRPKSINGSSSDLVGKTVDQAEAVYGKPMAQMKKGDEVILLFKDAEVHVKNGTIVSIHDR